MIEERTDQTFLSTSSTAEEYIPFTFDRLIEIIKNMPPMPVNLFVALVEKYGYKNFDKIRMIVPKRLFVSSGPTLHSIKVPEQVRFSHYLEENVFIINDEESARDNITVAMRQVVEKIWEKADRADYVESSSELVEKVMDK